MSFMIFILISFLLVSEGKIQIDDSKIQTVTDGLVPMSRCDLERCLGCSDFYCKYLCNFSDIGTGLASPHRHRTWDIEHRMDPMKPRNPERKCISPSFLTPSTPIYQGSCGSLFLFCL